MWNNELASELEDYLREFLIHNNWDDEYTKAQARSVFTTICLVEGIDADTARTDAILEKLYSEAAIEETDTSFDDFERYMYELIV